MRERDFAYSSTLGQSCDIGQVSHLLQTSKLPGGESGEDHSTCLADLVEKFVR